MNFNKALSVAAAAAMAVSVVAVSVSAADPVTVELDSSYTGDWSRTTGIEKTYFDNFEGDVKVVLQVETVNVKDGNTYIIKPMDVDKSWDAITSKLTAEKAVCKPDGFMQIRADQTEVEFVVPKDVVAELWGGGIAFQVQNVIVKSATLSDGTPENEFTIVSDADTPDYCAGKFDPWAVEEEAPAEVPAEETTDAEVEPTVEEEVEAEVEDTVEDDAEIEEEVEEEVEEEDFEEEDTDASGLLELDQEGVSLIQVGGEGTSNNWGQAVVMYTYNNIAEDEEPGENPFDVSLLNENSCVVVYYESDVAPELILQSWSGGNGWAKVPQNEELSAPGMAVFTYDYMTAMYETDDFSTLDAVNIGDQGAELTVYGVYVLNVTDEAAADIVGSIEETEEETADDTAAPEAPAADTADTTAPKTGNAGLAAIAGVIAVAGAAAVTFKKRK